MRQKFVPEKEPATQAVKNIRRATRRHSSADPYKAFIRERAKV
jgi:ribosomal protein L31E